MFEALRDYPNIMPYIHLPLQSGSNEILRKMGRRYTKEEYCALVDKLREIVPNVAISTDIIVGFPNETDQDFQDTLDVVNYVKYDSAFTFIYSPRVGTPAANIVDTIDDKTKHQRFNKLVDTLNIYIREKSEAYVGKEVLVLVEGASKTNSDILSGYTETNKLVNFKGNIEHIGKIVKVKIVEATTHYLKGEEIDG
jgi:tRNA-2-methylthio-N6-dimethylallyladenosine synthase